MIETPSKVILPSLLSLIPQTSLISTFRMSLFDLLNSTVQRRWRIYSELYQTSSLVTCDEFKPFSYRIVCIFVYDKRLFALRKDAYIGKLNHTENVSFRDGRVINTIHDLSTTISTKEIYPVLEHEELLVHRLEVILVTSVQDDLFHSIIKDILQGGRIWSSREKHRKHLRVMFLTI